MAVPTVTYTFTNGATSDGPQVNQNFTDILNALTDGTKSLTIAALSASTGAFSGAVTLSSTLAVTGVTTMTVASTNALNIFRDTNAGDSTSSVGINLGNSGSAQGQFTVRFTNAAAAANQRVLMTLTPRNNAGTTNTDCVRFTLAKVAGGDGGSLVMETATTGGTLTSGLAIDSSQQVTIGAGAAGQHTLNTLLATNGAQVATITNLPAAATAGNPFGWYKMTINGTTSYIPFWH